ncbi:type II toxin-antitoxin system RelE/ParE family toxin [Aequorivita capsosiphonis]|uniref:type II toxin-antitoxin system RelE/ParE family toxin n=1 Tax=Aequorivita capsosiphonis TaxID=487317 RepID=UPI0004173F3C|nr:type II toxin-antitoxin system RelE/ParE family toxin [Aequorivita capsosiphonis]
MYKLRIRILAQKDADEIYEYYHLLNSTLANRFLHSLYSELDALIENPELYQLKYKTTRVRYLKKFPFGIHYRVVDEKFIEVLSIIHTSRNPETWKKRSR